MTEQIPFQFHITINKISGTEVADFKGFCKRIQASPKLITLPQGLHVNQPMISKVTDLVDYESAVNLAHSYSKQMNNAGFEVKRIKIEIPANKHMRVKLPQSAFVPYFEWHGKAPSVTHKCFSTLLGYPFSLLSANSLDESPDERYITLRDFESLDKFVEKINRISNDLSLLGIALIKEKGEYCIYDSNDILDKGWVN